MRRRISIRGCVRPSVRRSVGPSVCPMLFSKVERTHTRRILCRVSGLVLLSPVLATRCGQSKLEPLSDLLAESSFQHESGFRLRAIPAAAARDLALQSHFPGFCFYLLGGRPIRLLRLSGRVLRSAGDIIDSWVSHRKATGPFWDPEHFL